jgi:hypothetical protein
MAGAAPMAVRTYELAVHDLGLDPFKAVGLPNEPPDLHALGAHVIEFKDRGIGQGAIGART